MKMIQIHALVFEFHSRYFLSFHFALRFRRHSLGIVLRAPSQGLLLSLLVGARWSVSLVRHGVSVVDLSTDSICLGGQHAWDD